MSNPDLNYSLHPANCFNLKFRFNPERNRSQGLLANPNPHPNPNHISVAAAAEANAMEIMDSMEMHSAAMGR